MPRCPHCQSPRIVVVISPRPRAFCAACETRWVQDGSYQRDIRPPSGSAGSRRGSRPVRVPTPISQATKIRASWWPPEAGGWTSGGRIRSGPRPAPNADASARPRTARRSFRSTTTCRGARCMSSGPVSQPGIAS